MPKTNVRKGKGKGKGRKGQESKPLGMPEAAGRSLAQASDSQQRSVLGALGVEFTHENILQALSDPRNRIRTTGSHKQIKIMLPWSCDWQEGGERAVGTFAWVGSDQKRETKRVIKQLSRFSQMVSRCNISNDGGCGEDSIDSRQGQLRPEKAKTPKVRPANIIKTHKGQVTENIPETHRPEVKTTGVAMVLKQWRESVQAIKQTHVSLAQKEQNKRSVEAINALGDLFETSVKSLGLEHDQKSLKNTLLESYIAETGDLFSAFLNDIGQRYQALDGCPVEQAMVLVTEMVSYLEQLNFNQNNITVLEFYVHIMIYKNIICIITDILVKNMAIKEVFSGKISVADMEKFTPVRPQEKIEGNLCSVIGDIISVYCKVIDASIVVNQASGNKYMSDNDLGPLAELLCKIDIFCSGAVGRADNGSCEKDSLVGMAKEASMLRIKVFHEFRRYYAESTSYSIEFYVRCLSFLHLEVRCVCLDIQNSMCGDASVRGNINTLRGYYKTLCSLRNKLDTEEEILKLLMPSASEMAGVPEVLRQMNDSSYALNRDIDITSICVLSFLMNLFMSNARIEDALITANDLMVMICVFNSDQYTLEHSCSFMKVLDSYFHSIAPSAEVCAGQHKSTFDSFSFDSWSYALSLCYNFSQYFKVPFSDKPAYAINKLYSFFSSNENQIPYAARQKAFLRVTTMCFKLLDQFQRIDSARCATVGINSVTDAMVAVAAMQVNCMALIKADRQQVISCLNKFVELFPLLSAPILSSECGVSGARLNSSVEIRKMNNYRYTRNFYSLIGKFKSHLLNIISCGEHASSLPAQINELSESIFTHCADVCIRTKNRDEFPSSKRLQYNLCIIILFFTAVRKPFSANLSQIFSMFKQLEEYAKCDFGLDVAVEERALIAACGEQAFDSLSVITRSACQDEYQARVNSNLDILSNIFKSSGGGAASEPGSAGQDMSKALTTLSIITNLPNFHKDSKHNAQSAARGCPA